MMNLAKSILFSLYFQLFLGTVSVAQSLTFVSKNANKPETANVAAKTQSERSDDPIRQRCIDHSFLATLRSSGINDACDEMGIDFDEVFAIMTAGVDHPYRQYRWSVSSDEHGNRVIHAIPPEEETGWTPWERWSMKNNRPVRTAWVLYPLKVPIERGIVRWYQLEETEDLKPRLLHKPDELVAMLRLARIDAAAVWLGLDFQAVFIDPLTEEARKIYKQYRWIVIPHSLAIDGPVIYALPPMDKSDDWPWESWYTDGITPVIHHVHYTKKKSNTSGIWAEGPGAPQRPAEIFGHTWFWYDDPEMMPALAEKD